jgi:replicative DNA helicase
MIEEREIPIDRLTHFGPTFQNKCMVALATDKPFLEQSIDIINPAYFDNEGTEWIVDKILWYFKTYRAMPTPEVFGGEWKKISNDVEKAAVKERLTGLFTDIKNPPSDLKYIKDELLTFCKNQALKNAVLKSADLLEAGRYEQIKTIIDQAMHAGQERNVGHVYVEDLEIRTNPIARNPVPTPWDCINSITDGGLGGGELACVVAPSGIGKSWFLSAIGAHAVKLGKTVAHYTMELSETYCGLRYDTIYSGYEPNQIRHHKAEVAEIIKRLPGRMIVKYFPTRTITIHAISAHIQRLMNLGIAPDLLLIDYADLMKAASKSDARHEELGYIHEEIRGLLGELKIPGWTASQSQRSSLQDDVVEADKIAGSYAKIMTDDLVISASRKMGDKMTNTARVHVIKNRFGPDGGVYPSHMDLAHGQIQVYAEDSVEGIALKQRMQSGEGSIKKMLQQKLIDMSKPDQNSK